MLSPDLSHLLSLSTASRPLLSHLHSPQQCARWGASRALLSLFPWELSRAQDSGGAEQEAGGRRQEGEGGLLRAGLKRFTVARVYSGQAKVTTNKICFALFSFLLSCRADGHGNGWVLGSRKLPFFLSFICPGVSLQLAACLLATVPVCAVGPLHVPLQCNAYS